MANVQRTLGKPGWPQKFLDSHCHPIRLEIVRNVTFEVGILPFRACHNVIVIVANDVTINAGKSQNFFIIVGIVRNIPDMKDARLPTISLRESFQPFLVFWR